MVSWGLTTYLAIILGVSLTTFLFKMLKPDPELHRPDRLYLILGGMIVLSIIGLILGLGIGHTAPANPRRRIEPNFLPELKRYVKIIFATRALALTVLGLAYFWGLGSLILSHVMVWGRASLGFEELGAGDVVSAAGAGDRGWVRHWRE